MTTKSITTGFRTTGIYPVHRNAIVLPGEKKKLLSEETGVPYIPPFTPSKQQRIHDSFEGQCSDDEEVSSARKEREKEKKAQEDRARVREQSEKSKQDAKERREIAKRSKKGKKAKENAGQNKNAKNTQCKRTKGVMHATYICLYVAWWLSR